MSEEGATSGAPAAGSDSGRFWLTLGALVLLALTLRLVRIGADVPFTLSWSNSEIVDGPWYLAEAIDGARGREADIPSHYRKPLFTWAAKIAYSAPAIWLHRQLGGSSWLEIAQAFAAAFGALLVLAVGVGGRRAFGARAGLLAAGLIAAAYVPVGYGRVPVVYGPMAAGLAVAFCVLAVGATGRSAGRAGRVRIAVGIGASLLGIAALAGGLKVTAIFAAPAFALAVVWLLRPSALVTALGAVVAVGLSGLALLAAPDLVRVTWAKAQTYLGPEGSDPVALLKRVINAAWRSDLTRRAPVLFGVGWIGVRDALAPWPQDERARTERALERVLAVWICVWVLGLGAFAFAPEERRVPIRHFMPALVPAALLAGRWLGRVWAGGTLLRRVARPWAFAWGWLTVYWILGTVLGGLYARQQAPPWMLKVASFWGLSLCSFVVVAAGMAVAAWRRRRSDSQTRIPAGAGRTVVIAVLSAALVINGLYLAQWLGWPTYDLLAANREVATLLAPGARVSGNWPHALTYDAPEVGRSLPLPDRTKQFPSTLDKTHLLLGQMNLIWVRRAFASRDLPQPTPVAVFNIRTYPVVLFRLPWAEENGYRPSAAERRSERALRGAASVPAPAGKPAR